MISQPTAPRTHRTNQDDLASCRCVRPPLRLPVKPSLRHTYYRRCGKSRPGRQRTFRPWVQARRPPPPVLLPCSHSPAYPTPSCNAFSTPDFVPIRASWVVSHSAFTCPSASCPSARPRSGPPTRERAISPKHALHRTARPLCFLTGAHTRFYRHYFFGVAFVHDLCSCVEASVFEALFKLLSFFFLFSLSFLSASYLPALSLILLALIPPPLRCRSFLPWYAFFAGTVPLPRKPRLRATALCPTTDGQHSTQFSARP